MSPDIIDIPHDMTDTDLPKSWRFGCHWSEPGSSGFFLVPDDGGLPTLRGRVRPDLKLDRGDTSGWLQNHVVTAAAVAERIARACKTIGGAE